ncbi:hypothetical protein K1719_025607 [Acacia pycnantha]|nr:hypothetical protein K1719_025607 [Acacia pycnantha]
METTNPVAHHEDIIFTISEKRHGLFRRDGDDMELDLEIPLLKALTGSIISLRRAMPLSKEPRMRKLENYISNCIS